jgi:5-deoxy-glucuronate isomerase
VLRLAPGRPWSASLAGREACVVLLSGRCSVSGAGTEWPDVGGRDGVFDGLPHAVYLPPCPVLSLEAAGGAAEVAICTAPARRGVAPALLGPDQVQVFTRGAGGTAREVRNILMEDRPAESLLVTEVVTPGGHWSSYPPHKHDTDDPPREAALEETYYHRLRRPGGFAVQRVYTGDGSLDETLTVRDGDVVLVPRGYHPVGAAAGYDLYYLNVMAGPVRAWRVTTDPSHEWIR